MYRAERYFLANGVCQPEIVSHSLLRTCNNVLVRIIWHVAWRQPDLPWGTLKGVLTLATLEATMCPAWLKERGWETNRRSKGARDLTIIPTSEQLEATIKTMLLELLGAYNDAPKLVVRPLPIQGSMSIQEATTETSSRNMKGTNGPKLRATTRPESQRAEDAVQAEIGAKSEWTTYSPLGSKVSNTFLQLFVLMLFSVSVRFIRLIREHPKHPRAGYHLWSKGARSPFQVQLGWTRRKLAPVILNFKEPFFEDSRFGLRRLHHQPKEALMIKGGIHGPTQRTQHNLSDPYKVDEIKAEEGHGNKMGRSSKDLEDKVQLEGAGNVRTRDAKGQQGPSTNPAARVQRNKFAFGALIGSNLAFQPRGPSTRPSQGYGPSDHDGLDLSSGESKTATWLGQQAQGVTSGLKRFFHGMHKAQPKEDQREHGPRVSNLGFQPP